MKLFIKKIIIFFRLGKVARLCRFAGYYVLDIVGNILFSGLRIFGLISPIKRFDKDQIKKILIIRLDRIGDIILSTPAIRAVKETFSNAQLHMLITGYTKDLLINNKNIDELLIYKINNIDHNYDLALALHPGIKQNYLTFTSGARWRVGYAGKGGSFFLTHGLKDDRARRIRHEVDSALEVVGAVGWKTGNKRLEISVTVEGEKFAQEFFRDNDLDGLIVVIHPGSRQSYIRWKKEGFAKVVDRLIMEENAKVILIGTEEERQLVEETASLITKRPLFAIGLKLTQLISLIKRCSLFIGNSTGPMHIAAALDIPVVAIFGPIHPLDSYGEWGPWGDKHIVVSKDLNCSGCHPTDCKTFDCMRLITVEEVLKAVREQIGRYREGEPV